VTPAWALDTIDKDAPTPYGARTLASIVLIFNHPLLSYPEATVRTCFAGQSRNLWNVGGHGLGIFRPREAFLDLFTVSGSGETGSAPNGNRLAIFARGHEGIGRDGVYARWRPSCDLGQRGVERRLP